MSEALSVHHGDFGRAALYLLDKPMVTHAHREGHLVFWVGDAHGDVPIADDTIRIDGGAAAAVSPWEPHSFQPDEGRPCLSLVLYIKPMWFLETSRSAEFSLSFGARSIELTPAVRLSLRRLTSLMLELESVSLFDGYLFELASLCFEQSWRCADTGAEPDDFSRLAANRFTDYRVRRSLRLMQENFTEDLDIDWLSRQAGLSRPHFFKLFRRQMGITPNLYLNTLRSELAIDELMNSRKSVTEISYDLGFSSQASFTRFFSTNVGIPPSDYRRVAHVN
ncbi:MAG: AraC family transcriptional regulator [Paracoccaceae bacterium]